MITGNKTIDQAIKADQKQIEHYKFMKKFAKTEESKQDFDKSIKRLEGRIERLMRQKD
jgi:predicted RecB family endonuclease